MQLLPEELEVIANEHLPDPVQAALLQAVFSAHEEAAMHARIYEPPEGENMFPFDVRARLEGLIRNIALRYPGLTASPERPKGFFYHTEMYSGRIVVTAAKVPEPAGMMRPSEYRRILASGLAETQNSLWAEEHDERPLYVVLTHSRYPFTDMTRRHLPESVHLVFPASDLERDIHVINLVDKYQPIVEGLLPEEWERPERDLYLRNARRRGYGWA